MVLQKFHVKLCFENYLWYQFYSPKMFVLIVEVNVYYERKLKDSIRSRNSRKNGCSMPFVHVLPKILNSKILRIRNFKVLKVFNHFLPSPGSSTSKLVILNGDMFIE